MEYLKVFIVNWLMKKLNEITIFLNCPSYTPNDSIEDQILSNATFDLMASN